MLAKYRLRWLMGVPFRLLFGQRTLKVKGEAGVGLRFWPAEQPRLLLGIKKLDAETRQQWAALLQPGERILDIGAHIGIATQRFYGLLNGDCRIWAFEPNPRIFELLRENSSQFGDKVTIYPYAIGDENKTVVFADNVRHGALSRLDHLRVGARTDSGYWNEASEIEVPMRTLDSLLDEHPDFHPSFVKIDVEGAGDLLMQGGERMFREFKPTCHAEYHSQREIDAIHDLLVSVGYRGVRFDEQQKPHWTESPDASTTFFAHPECSVAERIHD